MSPKQVKCFFPKLDPMPIWCFRDEEFHRETSKKNASALLYDSTLIKYFEPIREILVRSGDHESQNGCPIRQAAPSQDRFR